MGSVLLQEVFTPAILVNVPKQYKISASELNSFPRGEELGRHVKMLFYYRVFTLCLLGRVEGVACEYSWGAMEGGCIHRLERGRRRQRPFVGEMVKCPKTFDKHCSYQRQTITTENMIML